jgi:hypothetical protein
MKILLVHPDDDARSAPQSGRAWDRIVDLGLTGHKGYEAWANQFHCPVATLQSLQPGFEPLRQVRRLTNFGSGRLPDEHGLDWWELLSIMLHRELETCLRLRHFVKTLGSHDELYVSRPGLHASLVRYLLPERGQVLEPGDAPRKNTLGRYLRACRKLSASQIIDVFCDKYDQGYQLRGRLVRQPKAVRGPVVLLPTAYVNVSRTGLAYANTFPNQNFLLIATRRSGWRRDLPPNVTSAWLSHFASLRDRRAENESMQRNWHVLLDELKDVPEFEALSTLGYLDLFPQWLKRGLAIRDAWLNVFNTEPVQGVLCADDSNPYTRIPLLLAQVRALPNIACHHGALDGRYFFKKIHGDVIWVKGRMEEDYLVNKCGVPPEKIEIAAPAFTDNRTTARWDPVNRAHILFLSEPYEDGGGRASEFYRDILPTLADLALATRRKLIVKLHPGESKRERAGMIARILGREQREVTRIVRGPLTEDLLTQAWFGITILSTVAMECAIRGVPCFLCKWLEAGPYGYVDQFVRFHVGIALNNPDEVARIPDYLRSHSRNPTVRENCWKPAEVGRLRELLSLSAAGVHQEYDSSHRIINSRVQML